MSTQINQYLIYGVSLPYSFQKLWEEKTGKEFDDTFEGYMTDNPFKQEIGQKNGITILVDGMNGEYLVAGYVYKKSADHGYIGEGVLELNPNPIPAAMADFVSQEIKKMFSLEEEPALKNILLTHYR